MKTGGESHASKPLSCGHIRMNELARRLPPVKSKKRKSMCRLPPLFCSFPFRRGFLLCPHSFTKLFFTVSDTGNCQPHVSRYVLFQDNGTDKMRRTNNGFFTARICPFRIIRLRPCFTLQCDRFCRIHCILIVGNFPSPLLFLSLSATPYRTVLPKIYEKF